MTLINGRIAALLADLDREITRVLDKHFAEDAKGEDILRHHGPFSIQIHGVDGHVASFMEDGIDLYPGSD